MKQNNFIHRINKKDIDTLPLTAFNGRTIIVRNYYAVARAFKHLNTQTIVGVDTETHPSFKNGEHFPTALLQIATTDFCYLFQLSHTGFTKKMADFFANPNICKVGLAFKDDLAGLCKLRKFTPQNCIDIQNIVLPYGILDLGLQKIFAIIFSKKISKSQQLSNWDSDFLTPEQISYAATDAWATLQIYNELQQTKQLPKCKYLQLKAIDRQLQMRHQMEVSKKKQLNTHNDISDDNNLFEKT